MVIKYKKLRTFNDSHQISGPTPQQVCGRAAKIFEIKKDARREHAQVT